MMRADRAGRACPLHYRLSAGAAYGKDASRQAAAVPVPESEGLAECEEAAAAIL